MPFSIENNPALGLTLNWTTAQGLCFTGLPLRVRLRGANTFRVWAGTDSGEGLPAWAEPELAVELFDGGGPGIGGTCRLETIGQDGRIVGYRAHAQHPRVGAILEIRDHDGELALSLQLHDPQHAGGRRMPMGLVELEIGGLFLGELLTLGPYGFRVMALTRL